MSYSSPVPKPNQIDLKVEIINDLLQIHDLKFVEMNKQIKEINDKLKEMDNDNKILVEISPINTPIIEPINIVNDDEKNQNELQLTINQRHQSVKQWLSSKCLLPQYYDKFIQNGFEDISIIKLITDTQQILHQLGIKKVGHKLKIAHEIKMLQQSDNE